MKRSLLLMLVLLSTSFTKGQVAKPDSLPAMVYDTILPFGLTDEQIIDTLTTNKLTPLWEKVEGGYKKSVRYQSSQMDIYFASKIIKNKDNDQIKEIWVIVINGEDITLMTDIVSEFTIKIRRDVLVHQKLQAVMLKLLKGT